MEVGFELTQKLGDVHIRDIHTRRNFPNNIEFLRGYFLGDGLSSTSRKQELFNRRAMFILFKINPFC